MNKPKIVVDASVLLKFSIIEEDGLEQALRLRDGIVSGEIDASIPAFCLYECASTIARIRLPYLSHSDTFGIYKALRLVGCAEVDLDDSLVMDAYKLLKGVPKVSFYDALYHALALYLRATYITADKKYFDLMRHSGHIRLLKDY